MNTKIVVAGPRGKMGAEAIKMITNEPDFQLVACIDRKTAENGVDAHSHLNVPSFEDAEECFTEIETDIFVDLTVPDVGYVHTKAALEQNIRPVIGTTGFTDEQLNELSTLAWEKKIGCIIAPNFAIGAVLMMKFSKMAAKYFSDVDIIEKHHDNKLDAPSGSAIKTAELIKDRRTSKKQGHPNEKEVLPGARGADFDGMKIHSVRLPGLVAHQEVLFGSPGQTLSIKHDSYNRDSFMEGIKLSIKEVQNLEELVYGLENIL
ncbi:4-hydroxy-tetrahydrodipicolinate reductase [Virgibacillus natechei]|uniref:4-hydroxy-tetrahydrodipicolinate reductase n=1 Tax=Virgibacillus natechei TaxID=1216297 RepID=A0ABS4IH04_9BACI|nr:4-hydroxy-tetrahydrodipicolinate reductase [Virgibacillus natechei]MBP1969591.1 4-hydroxy-tetrahydrodipicolinate reductase [Virgibacillus natechei]UZD14819.1 4-hydroxy-tetrahydrodipicolinate reductase [Virgibacillus natechei]